MFNNGLHECIRREKLNPFEALFLLECHKITGHNIGINVLQGTETSLNVVDMPLNVSYGDLAAQFALTRE